MFLCAGRILDHMGRGALDLSKLKHVVLDEADQMLERGFADSVEEILAASFQQGLGLSLSLLSLSLSLSLHE